MIAVPKELPHHPSGIDLYGVEMWEGAKYNRLTMRMDAVNIDNIPICHDAPPGAQRDPAFMSSQAMRRLGTAAAQSATTVEQLEAVLADPVVRDACRSVADSIDRRADLGNAYRRGKHVGLVFGACVLITVLGALAGVAHWKPALACRAVLWLAGGR